MESRGAGGVCEVNLCTFAANGAGLRGRESRRTALRAAGGRGQSAAQRGGPLAGQPPCLGILRMNGGERRGRRFHRGGGLAFGDGGLSRGGAGACS